MAGFAVEGHVTVYRDSRYFCGWPFNGGFWQFEDGELAVGFIRGSCGYGDRHSVGHSVVDNLYGEQLIARSTDGGITWPKEAITSVYQRPAFDEITKTAPFQLAGEASYEPSADGFCLLSGFGIPPADAPDVLFVMVSADRGHSWSEPVRVRSKGFESLGGRPSYVTRDDGTVLLFGHGTRPGGHNVPLVFASKDGCRSWGLLAEMPLEPEHPTGIMPYPVLLPDGRVLAAVRRQYNIEDAYTQIYESRDSGRTWQFLSRVNDWGAPASITLLPDGRVACVYGYRRPPYGIRARVSDDSCRSWGDEYILRDDGGSYDLGYPRTQLRSDGKLVTAYYFNSQDDKIQQNGGVRNITCTIWQA